MSHSLSSWINHIKADDIDGGLAADFDGSLSGLGAELGPNPYNMSEALMALPPVFKQESVKNRGSDGKSDMGPGFSGFLSGGRSLTLPGRTSPVCGGSFSFQTVELPISGAHSLSLPNLQQHCSNSNSLDATAANVMTDTINSEWVSLMTSMNLGEVGDVEESGGESRFQYILNAATSPATRMSEETLTYLNQGQSYEIKLKRLRDGGETEEQLLKSIVRVVFHERRLQYMEKEQLDVWKLTRPGERIVDIDIPMCRGLIDVKIDPHRLNCVEFVWDPRHPLETKVAVKIHCISTEFTAKKHGGEKGVPFRIQVETYTYSPVSDHQPVLRHCASCQVKVFKPKGADRKHKTDREKIERRSTSEKEKYQPSYECTVLTEIPLEQVHKYLELLGRQQEDDERRGGGGGGGGGKDSTSNVTVAAPCGGNGDVMLPAAAVTTTTVVPVIAPTAAVCSSSVAIQSIQPIQHVVISDIVVGTPSTLLEQRCSNIVDTAAAVGPISNNCASVLSNPTPVSVTPSTSNVSRKRPSETTLSLSSNSSSSSNIQHLLPVEQHVSVSRPTIQALQDTLLISSTAEEVSAWLARNRFSNFVQTFQNFSGADLLRLYRDDFIQICGLADGIRLYNALQARNVRPKLTIFVCQQSFASDQLDGSDGGKPLWSSSSTDASAVNVANVKQNSRSSTPSPTGDVLLIKPRPLQHEGDQTALLPADEQKEEDEDEGEGLKCSLTDGSQSQQQLNGSLVTTSSTTRSVVESKSLNIVGDRREMASQTVSSIASKRQITENDDEDDENVLSFTANKKQRMQCLEFGQREVYHAVYLDMLTEGNLREKLATLYGVPIVRLFLQGPSGIHILITDLVVQNFRDQSSFVIDAVQDADNGSVYRVIMKSVDIAVPL